MMINLHRQSKQWPYRGVKMENLTLFALKLEEEDCFMSCDVNIENRQLRLHRQMSDFFSFRYEERFYCCVAIHFPCGPSALWFTEMMGQF